MANFPNTKELKERKNSTVKLYAEDIRNLKKGGYLHAKAYGRWIRIEYVKEVV